MLAHLLRYDVRYAQIKSAVEQGVIGRPLVCYARRNATIQEARRLKGRVEVEEYISVHDIDQVLWYLQGPGGQGERRDRRGSGQEGAGRARLHLDHHPVRRRRPGRGGDRLGPVRGDGALEAALHLGRLRRRVPGADRGEGLAVPGLPAHDPGRPWTRRAGSSPTRCTGRSCTARWWATCWTRTATSCACCGARRRSSPRGRTAAPALEVVLAASAPGGKTSRFGFRAANPAGALFYSSSSISSNSWTSTGGTQPSGARASVSSTICTSSGFVSFRCSSSSASKSSLSGSRGKGSRAISS